MSPFVAGIVGFAFLVILFMAGVPIAFAMALVGMVGFIYLVSFSSGLSLPVRDIFTQFTSYPLTVIPMFVLMGTYAFAAGIGRKLFSTAYTMMGQTRGGLAIASILGVRRVRRCLRVNIGHLRHHRPGGHSGDEEIQIQRRPIDRHSRRRRRARHHDPAEHHLRCLWYSD